MIKGVIFDMDGVLVDNSPVHRDVFIKFCEKYGSKITAEDFSFFAGKGNAEIFPDVLPADVIEKYGLDNLIAEKERMYREYYASFIEPAKGLITLLEDLTSNGYKCAVGSSAPKANVDFVLDACGIRKYFETTVYDELVTRCKPDPEIFRLAAKRLGTEPSGTLVIEDAIAGIQAARAAGMNVIGITTTVSRERLETAKEATPDLIISSLTELSVAVIREKFDR